MKLSRLWQRPTPAPQSAEEFAQRVTVDQADLDLYQRMSARVRELETRGSAFARRLTSQQDAAQVAVNRFRQSLTEDDFQAALDAASEAATIGSLRTLDPHLASNLLTGVNGWSIMAREFPNWRADMLRLLEGMKARVTEEIARVTPLEELAMREAEAARAREYGERPSLNDPPVSPLVERLRQQLSSIVRCIAHFRQGPGMPSDRELFSYIECLINPILKNFQG